MRSALILIGLLPVACGQGGPESPAQVAGAVVVLHTPTEILTVPAGDWADDSPLRAEVEASFPAACVDLDDDGDGVPNVVDVDRADDDAEDRVEHECHRCNRGPGSAGDFRLRIDGTDARIDRGMVIARAADGTLTVPSPDGAITIVVTSATRIDGGEPTPGSEIRVEGTLTGPNAITATQVEVLCAGPTPLDPSEVPPEAEPVPDDHPHHS